jgi:hypothetical protein
VTSVSETVVPLGCPEVKRATPQGSGPLLLWRRIHAPLDPRGRRAAHCGPLQPSQENTMAANDLALPLSADLLLRVLR